MFTFCLSHTAVKVRPICCYNWQSSSVDFSKPRLVFGAEGRECGRQKFSCFPRLRSVKIRVRNPTTFSPIKYYNQPSENSILESRNVVCIKYDPDNGQWPILVQSQNSEKRQILDDPFF